MELPFYVEELIKNTYLRVRCLEMAKENNEESPKTCIFWQPWLPDEDSSKANSTKQLPTTKWKRDRRIRPEYLRKSDPKISECFNQEEFSNEVQNYNSSNSLKFINGSNGCSPSADIPLDMSIRQRGQPPSYSQTINNPCYRSSYRPSVITQTPQRGDIPSGISMCDPIIDEHFRRSLGKDYIKIFSNNNIPQKESSSMKFNSKINGHAVESEDNVSLSVDDHFAKALGDTWLKLNKKENENESTDKEAVISV